MILENSDKLLFMHDTRFRFVEWTAKIGTKTDCVVFICNIYIIYTYNMYIYNIYIYIICIYIYKDKTMTIFTQGTVINYSIIRTPNFENIFDW